MSVTNQHQSEQFPPTTPMSVIETEPQVGQPVLTVVESAPVTEPVGPVTGVNDLLGRFKADPEAPVVSPIRLPARLRRVGRHALQVFTGGGRHVDTTRHQPEVPADHSDYANAREEALKRGFPESRIETVPGGLSLAAIQQAASETAPAPSRGDLLDQMLAAARNRASATPAAANRPIEIIGDSSAGDSVDVVSAPRPQQAAREIAAGELGDISLTRLVKGVSREQADADARARWLAQEGNNESPSAQVSMFEPVVPVTEADPADQRRSEQ